MADMIKVIAGKTLKQAEVNMDVVYFNPRKYKF